MLFQIENSSSHLLGSYHVVPRDFRVPELWQKAFRNARLLITESDPKHSSSVSRKYQDGTCIQDHLPADLYEKLLSACQFIGMRPEKLQAHFPWSVALEIGRQLDRFSGRNHSGVDGFFFERAKAFKRPIKYLEDDPLLTISKIDTQQIVDQLRFLSNDVKGAIKRSDGIFSAWEAEDPIGMLAAAPELEMFPDIYQKMFVDRNIAWIPSLIGALTSDTPTLAIVGALHLAGKSSLIELLADHGISVRHIPR